MNSISSMKLIELRDSFQLQKNPQRNGVVERKNRTVQEAATTMLNEERSCIHNYLHTEQRENHSE